MPSLAAIRITNLKYTSSYRPVAVFVGGTSGIGEGMARAFARHRNGNADIYIVGRNGAAAQASFASFPSTPQTGALPAPSRQFVECDLTLMRNVKRTTDDLVARLPKVNFLVLSPGIMTLSGRDETEEGIDKKLALHYYARWKFIDGLMPLLRKAKDAGEDAKVMSVLGAGSSQVIDLDDLGLKKTYTLGSAALTAATYNDLMVEKFAELHPDIAFTHIAPGAIVTPLLRGQDSDRLLRAIYPVMKGLSYFIGTSPDECAEYMWYGLHQGTVGAFRRNRHGEDIGKNPSECTDEAREKLWEHTVNATSV